MAESLLVGRNFVSAFVS